MSLMTCLIVIATFILLPVVISIVLESLRKPAQIPEHLYWSEHIPIQYMQLDEMKIRFIKTGEGPNLVLLHTLRTQLDIFEKVIPQLAKDFTVYALDLPGHGFSSIPKTDYVPDLFVKTVEQFIDKLEINTATIAGVSIGGTIPLLMAAKGNDRIQRIVAINPYDYGKGRGVERGNFVAWLIFSLSRIPVLGETVMRFRNPMIEKLIFQGGVIDPKALSIGFLQQVWQSGIRKGHYQGFINLIRNARKWEESRSVYPKITVPVALVYGDNDWSTVEERERNHSEIASSTIETVKNGGHFLVLDRPDEVIKLIKQ